MELKLVSMLFFNFSQATTKSVRPKTETQLCKCFVHWALLISVRTQETFSLEKADPFTHHNVAYVNVKYLV